MKQLSLPIRFFLVTLIAIACGWSNSAQSQAAIQTLPKGLEAVVKLFAGSHILGTGASHFVTSVRVIDDNNAVAIVGEGSGDRRNPNAYTVHAKRINQKWKIVRYEFVFEPTGKKVSKDQTPPFPYPNWRKDAP
jgi:hypothetical protein